MIVPMTKYSFLVYHKDYPNFLDELQQVGVLHIISRDLPSSPEINQKLAEVNQIDKAVQFLNRIDALDSDLLEDMPANEVLELLHSNQVKLEELQLKKEEICKEIQKVQPWGEFSPELIAGLKSKGIKIRFFKGTAKLFLHLLEMDFPVEMVSEQGNVAYFLLVQRGDEEFEVDAEEVAVPRQPASALEKIQNEIDAEIESIEKLFGQLADRSVDTLKIRKKEIIESLEVDRAVLNTVNQADDHLKILEGWVPGTKKREIDKFLEGSGVLFLSEKPRPGDKIPVLLKNNRFSKLFEPIGSMFSLPDYSELDLTVFFAPFFMLFFGFCLGDAGYGLLFLIGGGLYKLKAAKSVKPYLSLIQFLGVATMLFGTISGTFFGINLIEAKVSWLEEYKQLFLNPDKMFNLALILGAVQIIFGMFIRAANQIKQFGFPYALATIGWLIVLLGSVANLILTGTGVIQESKTVWYVILFSGGFFILFFSDPSVNVFSRVGKGVWDVYSTVTGIFGDLLSYIRLFALGLSSAILGFVINDIGLQILGSSKILGPVFFVIFLIFGHTLNILISSLGSFVHPMRLTFVEFYKSAGFKGGGEEYKPFKK